MTIKGKKVHGWMGVVLALALGLTLALLIDRGTSTANAQAGSGGITLSVAQLRINQRISQAAVRRSNRANARLDALAGGGGAPGAPGPQGPQGPAGPPGPSGGVQSFTVNLAANEQADLSINGPLRFYALCTIDDGNQADQVQVLVVSAAPNARWNGGNAPAGTVTLTPGAENVTRAFTQPTADPPALVQRGHVEAHVVQGDQGLSLSLNDLSLGLSLVGNDTCTVSGTASVASAPV